jgi:hypothetical protein
MSTYGSRRAYLLSQDFKNRHSFSGVSSQPRENTEAFRERQFSNHCRENMSVRLAGPILPNTCISVPCPARSLYCSIILGLRSSLPLTLYRPLANTTSLRSEAQCLQVHRILDACCSSAPLKKSWQGSEYWCHRSATRHESTTIFQCPGRRSHLHLQVWAGRKNELCKVRDCGFGV